MKQDGNLPMAFYTMGIACLFLAGFFLLVFFGARSYRDAVTGQTENNQSRVLLSYLSTCKHSGRGVRVLLSDLLAGRQVDGGIRTGTGADQSGGGPGNRRDKKVFGGGSIRGYFCRDHRRGQGIISYAKQSGGHAGR